MATTILLIVIYLTFISLGLPDSILGSAWPSIYPDLHINISYAGIISMIISGGTILTSLFSMRLIRRFGTGIVIVVSVAMSAIALFGFSFSNTFWQLCLWGIPYGLGAGSIDVALNNFVALQYKSRHMSWLHCFWGIGASIGPYIMGLCLMNGLKWHAGYQSIGFIQIILFLILFFTLPLWKSAKGEKKVERQESAALSIKEVIKLPGAKAILAAFFCYCALESTAGFWASSYLVLFKHVSTVTAARWASLFYLGITIGRFLCGFIADHLGNKFMIRVGHGIVGFGVLFLLLPLPDTATLIGLVIVGLGCAPIFPCLLHETPQNFGKDKSQSIMGMQMACAYMASTFMPPLFGILTEVINIRIFPIFLLVFTCIMFIMSERMNRLHKKGTDCVNIENY